MRSESMKFKSSSSWSKLAVGKWLNRKSNPEKYYYQSGGGTVDTERRKSFSDQHNNSDHHFSGWLKHSTNGTKRSEELGEEKPPANTDAALNLRMFVGTWNVGGKSPNEGLDLRDWLTSPSPADIYVIGFQEIVPLNAGNVLGPEDGGPAAKWVRLIDEALNNNNNNSRRVGEYCQKVACKQMVGIFLSVWVRQHHCTHVTNLNVSCVGTGILGYLGNKGSISISMTLHDATFCFVCTHLASGEKYGDELRRNLDVSEILKRTKFFSHHHRHHRYRWFKSIGYPLPLPPQTIMEHDNVIWLGDLNYRLAAEYGDIHEQVINNNWEALLEKDQLRIEQRAGRIFEGWNEGSIYFAPTYKYLTNSDEYYVSAATQTKEKRRRTPAWCDRILWKGGEGLDQMWYVRGESKFSDHRPVCSMFSVKLVVEELRRTTTTTIVPRSISTCCGAASTNKVQAEEQLMLITRTQSCITTTPTRRLISS